MPDWNSAFVPRKKLSGYLLPKRMRPANMKLNSFLPSDSQNTTPALGRAIDVVVLKHNVDEHGLREGDVGTVVHIYRTDSAMDVEFVTGEGKTVAIITLEQSDIRTMGDRDILHVRELVA